PECAVRLTRFRLLGPFRPLRGLPVRAEVLGVITFENVSKSYPKSVRPALNDVSVEVSKGEFLFLVGASGSGKSTFLRLVLREDRPSSGSVHVAGKDLNRLAN